MILKSMSRKAPTFKQLASYIGQQGSVNDDGFVARNLYYQGGDQRRVTRIFQENHQWLPARKNGNALYHEVLVLPPQPHLPRKRINSILQDLAYKYHDLRGNGQLMWGRTHFDTDYPHIHLMLSANEVASDRRKRLTKQSFANIQQQLEQYKEVTFPELVDERVYNRQKSKAVKIKSPEGEMIRRTKTPSKKQTVSQTLQRLFSDVTDTAQLKDRLARQGFSLYQRGQQWGVRDNQTQRRYRLRTLGLADQFAELIAPQQTQTRAANTKTEPHRDVREAGLRQQRQRLDDYAQTEVERFDRDHPEDLER